MMHRAMAGRRLRMHRPKNGKWALCHGRHLSHQFQLVTNRTQEGLPPPQYFRLGAAGSISSSIQRAGCPLKFH